MTATPTQIPINSVGWTSLGNGPMEVVIAQYGWGAFIHLREQDVIPALGAEAHVELSATSPRHEFHDASGVWAIVATPGQIATLDVVTGITVPGGGGSGGGSGGAATIADGADVAQGTTTDAAGASTIMGQIKAAAVSLAAILAKLIAGVPVTGAFFQATQPVSAAALPLPAGAATSALQPALNGDGGALAHVTNFPATQPVSAAALPLPAGAATSAAQAALLTALGAPAQAGATVPTTETYANVAASAAPVSVGQAATLIVAARTGRKEVTLILEAAVALRVGGSGVGASANGVLIQGVAGEALTISGGAAVYGYAPTGTAIVSALEVF